MTGRVHGSGQLPVRLGVALLPDLPWPDALAQWTRLDRLGVDHLWTYDHLSWRDLRDGPWFGAVPLLAAVASLTSRSLLGTLVASPNFRHPVPFAKEAMTLAEISGQRFICGVGAGGTGWDATVLGTPSWTRLERTERFIEFVDVLALLLEQESTTYHGRYYASEEARMIPTRAVPLAVAATGDRGMDLVARHGDWWITFGHPTAAAGMGRTEAMDEARRQIERLDAALARNGEPIRQVRRAILVGSSAEPWCESAASFVDLAHAYAGLGFTDIIVHAPRRAAPFDYRPEVFEAILDVAGCSGS